MNLTRIAILGVAAIAAISAALLVRGMLGGGTPQVQASAPPPPATIDVLVASKDILPGHALDPASVRWEPWPKTTSAQGLITKDDQPDLTKAIEGAVSRTPLLAGQPITQASIVHSGEASFMAATLTPGMRAVGIPTTAENGAGGFILANDHVDVILTRDVGSGTSVKIFQSETLLRDVRVLAVDQVVKPDKDQQSHVGKTVTLELTPAQAEIVEKSKAMGTLSLALRPLGETQDKPVADNGARKVQRVTSVSVIRYGVAHSAEAVRPGAAGRAQ
jgi:pilus assembly protein CpaB